MKLLYRLCHWILRHEPRISAQRVPSVGFGVEVMTVYIDEDGDRPRVHWSVALSKDGELIVEATNLDLGKAFEDAYVHATHDAVAL